jgi:hypothetical protein
MCEREAADDQRLQRWMFTDEATFHVSGQVNTGNAVIWGTENPHISYKLQWPTHKVNVWCGVTRDKMYSPFIFSEETVRAPNYLDMLQALYSCYWRKMGHWTPSSSNMMELSHIGLSETWRLQIFVWAYVSSRADRQKPQDEADLWQKITATFAQITLEMLSTSLCNLSAWYELYSVCCDGHVEC